MFSYRYKITGDNIYLQQGLIFKTAEVARRKSQSFIYFFIYILYFLLFSFLPVCPRNSYCGLADECIVYFGLHNIAEFLNFDSNHSLY
jgi:hypothetical protein